MAFTNFTKAEYLARYGVNLDRVIPSEDNEAGKATIRIAEVTEKIQEWILGKTASIDFDDLSTAQQTYINRACMEQLNYELNNANYSEESGYNAFSGEMHSLPEIRAREISVKAQRILNNHIITAGFY